MKHTRTVLKALATKPSLEAQAFEDMQEGESSDLGFLALEAYELTDEVCDQLDEADVLEEKSERGELLKDFIQSEVANDDRVATPNEIALIEQATDAVVDGTGETVETVIPSLESFEVKGGASPSLEALGGTISDFAKGAVQLVKNASESFKKYVKGLFSRLEALKNLISDVEKRASSAEFSESVEVSAALSVSAAWDDNSFASTFDKAISGMDSIAKKTTELSGSYAQKLLTKHDEFVNLVQKTFDAGLGRSDKKVLERSDLSKKFITNAEALGTLFQSTLSDGKEFGGLFVSNGEKLKSSEDFSAVSKSIVKCVPQVFRAGNVDGRSFTMTGVNKESVRRLCSILKNSTGALSRTKQTDSMFNVDFFTAQTDLGLVSSVVFGISSTQFQMAINRVNRAYVSGYTRPLMQYINHYFRVAEAQLAIAKKAMK